MLKQQASCSAGCYDTNEMGSVLGSADPLHSSLLVCIELFWTYFKARASKHGHTHCCTWSVKRSLGDLALA